MNGLEASAVGQSGSFYDAEGNATVVLTASSGTLTRDNAAGIWTWTATAGDGPGVTPITITAVDSLNGTSTATFTLNVGNTAPVAGIAAPVNGDVGTPINFSDGCKQWTYLGAVSNAKQHNLFFRNDGGPIGADIT